VDVRGDSIPWLCELQPMGDKTASSLALSIIQVVTSVIRAALDKSSELLASSKSKLWIIHLVTGDAINTNECALRMVAYHYLKDFDLAAMIKYRLVSNRRASHKVSLVTVVAITGFQMKNPVKGDAICCNIACLYKYLTPAYADEFGSQLREHILQNAKLLVQACLPKQQRPDHGLRLLYGQDVFPDSITEILNVDSRSLAHASLQITDVRAFRGLLFAELYKSIIRVENTPVITRFFLFGECAFSLLRAQLLELPGAIFTLEAKPSQKKTQRRITGFQTFYNDPERQVDLRRACLCLRLTNFAHKICAQQQSLSYLCKTQGGCPLLLGLGSKKCRCERARDFAPSYLLCITILDSTQQTRAPRFS